MATPSDEDIFEASILLLKVLPNRAELIKDERYMEELRSNIHQQWGPRLKAIIKELVPPTSTENRTAAAREEGEGEEGELKIAGLLERFKSKLLKPSEELKEADLMERREECSEWLILPSDEQFKELLIRDYKLMLNINQWSLLLAFRMGKRMNLLFNFHRRKSKSNKEAQKALMDDLKKIGINLKERSIRRKRKLATTLSEYPLMHFLRVGEWKIDKHCESIARYLKNNPEEAEFWKQNYSDWSKTAEPRQPATAETAADESLVDDDTGGPEIDEAAEDLLLNE